MQNSGTCSELSGGGGRVETSSLGLESGHVGGGGVQSGQLVLSDVRVKRHFLLGGQKNYFTV